MAGNEGRVCVITGAASGIGFALAQRAGAEGMVVVLVDIDEGALAGARAQLEADGASVHAFAVDVSEREAMVDLAARVRDQVGDVWLLLNNAGVFIAGAFLEIPPAQWDFTVGVNLWGVIHGMHAFLPGMVERDSGHVVNTSSLVGLVTVQNSSIYNATKHGVIALSETVHRELEDAGSNVGISVLCPGAIATDILRSARHWPARLGPAPPVGDGEYPQLDQVMSPATVAEITFAAVAQRRFWILTHPEQYASAIRARAEGAIAGLNPDDSSVDPNFRRESGRTPGRY